MNVYYSFGYTSKKQKTNSATALLLSHIKRHGINIVKPKQQPRKTGKGAPSTPSLVHLRNAELYIFEASNPTFSLGCEIMFALQNRKPLLILTNKIQTTAPLFVSESATGLVTMKEYVSLTEAKRAIDEFFSKYEEGYHSRITLHIDPLLYKKLGGYAIKHSISKTDSIEQAIVNYKNRRAEH